MPRRTTAATRATRASPAARRGPSSTARSSSGRTRRSRRSRQVISETGATVPLMYDARRVRADFPILSRTVNGKPLVYLDNAATTQKPQAVLDAIASYYTGINANVHRGVHELSQQA